MLRQVINQVGRGLIFLLQLIILFISGQAEPAWLPLLAWCLFGILFFYTSIFPSRVSKFEIWFRAVLFILFAFGVGYFSSGVETNSEAKGLLSAVIVAAISIVAIFLGYNRRGRRL
jgi:hypothetical protein